MKTLLTLLLLIAASVTAPARAAELVMTDYQRPDGAITTYFNGDSVDPYFASKALLAAQDAGMTTRTAAIRWIGWLLPRQHADGRFDRYCEKGQRFISCQEADADGMPLGGAARTSNSIQTAINASSASASWHETKRWPFTQ